MNTVTSSLWYIDGQYEKFESRYKHGKVPRIPELFFRFNKGMESNKGGYNDWISKRKKPPQLERKDLQEHADNLIGVLSHNRLSTSRWKQVKTAVEDLARAMRSYAEDMEQSLERTDKRHKALMSCRSPELNSESYDIPASKLPMKPIFAKLTARLECGLLRTHSSR